MKTFDEIRGNSLTEAAATAGDHEDAAHAHQMAANSVRQDLRAKKAHMSAASHHIDAIKHLNKGDKASAAMSHRAAKSQSKIARRYGNATSHLAHADTHSITHSIGEGYASAAQRKAIWANKADGGKGHPDNKKEAKSADVKPEKYTDANGKTKMRMVPVQREDSDAVKAFLAKGGKIKKLPPAKAQGYHGKDDPGADVHGLISKPDTKDMGTRKKVKSMEATQVDEISKDTKKSYIKKAVGDIDNRSFAQGLRDKNPTYTSADSKNNRKIANRRKGIDRALEANETDPPFDNAKKISTTPTKDQFGNVIKNRARSLARAAAKKAGGDMGDKQKKESVNELDQKTMNSYHAKAQRSKDRATNSAVATILRKGDHSKDLQTRNKREKGMALAKTRTLKSIRGDK